MSELDKRNAEAMLARHQRGVQLKKLVGTMSLPVARQAVVRLTLEQDELVALRDRLLAENEQLRQELAQARSALRSRGDA